MIRKKCLKRLLMGCLVAQSIECLTLEFSSGHDLTVLGIEPPMGLCVELEEPAWDSFSPTLPAPPALSSP